MMIGNPFFWLQKLVRMLSGREARNSELVCDVCSVAPASGVFSSKFGPVSHAACERCNKEGAESLFMLCYHMHNAGGPEKAQVRFADARSYHDGNYIGLEEILALYPDYEGSF